MDLLNRYLAAVEQALTIDNKEDVIREIRANILDELEEHSSDDNNREAALNVILQKYGHPTATAQQYAPHAPLVAPEDMPLYKSVLWHGAALVFVFSLLRTVSSMLQSDSINPFRLLFQTANSFVEYLGFIVLLVTISFYYLGKHGMLSHWRYNNWTPAKLPQYPNATISLSDTLSDLTTVAFLLLLLWTPLWMSQGAQQGLLLSFAPSHEYWRLVLTVLCVASGVFALYRLSQTTWKRWSLSAYLIDHLGFGIAFLWMASQENVFIVANQEIQKNWPQFTHFIESNLQESLAICGVVIIIVGAFQAKKLKRLQ